MDASPPLSAPAPLARVGPNAVTQLAAALTDRLGAATAARVFVAAGQGGFLAVPPTGMVDERVPAALLDALWRCLPVEAPALAAEAGRRTADYVVAHRIPKAARLALALSPRPLASRRLLGAIEAHAWTFAGSGACTTRAHPRPLIAIKANPLACPECAWHRGVLARLFHRLVRRGATCRHTACCREGARECRFEILWPAHPERDPE